MQTVVVDASLALRWALPDEHSVQAAAALDRWEQGEVVFYAPAHFWAEVANGLYQACRKTRITQEEARQAFEWLSKVGFVTVDGTGTCQAALDLALRKQGQAVYDFIYVVTAQVFGLELWTADRRLHNTLGSDVSGIQYFGQESA